MFILLITLKSQGEIGIEVGREGEYDFMDFMIQFNEFVKKVNKDVRGKPRIYRILPRIHIIKKTDLI